MKTLILAVGVLLVAVHCQAQRYYGGARYGQPSYQEQIQSESARASAVVTHTPQEWKRIYEQQRKAAEESSREASEEAAKEAKRKANVGLSVTGKVIQILDYGMLVESVSHYSESKNSYSYTGTCLLVGHPDESTKVDGDKIDVPVRLTGQFSYENVLGARKTVHKFKVVTESKTNAAPAVVVGTNVLARIR